MHDHAHDDHDHDAFAPAAPGRRAHPLIARLETELGWPRLGTLAEAEAFVARPGAHCLFIPGDPARNLESADAAVILPELRMAFQHVFDCAVVGDGIEAELRERHRALKTPGYLFFRDGAYLGSIEKIRDWDDYVGRTSHILGRQG